MPQQRSLSELPVEMQLLLIEHCLSVGCRSYAAKPPATEGISCAVDVDILFNLVAVNRQFRNLVLPFLWERRLWRMHYAKDPYCPGYQSAAHMHPSVCEKCAISDRISTPIYKLPQQLWPRLQILDVGVGDFHKLLQIYCEARFAEQYSRHKTVGAAQARSVALTETEFAVSAYACSPRSIRCLNIMIDDADPDAAKTVHCAVLNKGGICVPDPAMAANFWEETLWLMPSLQEIRYHRHGRLNDEVRGRYHAHDQGYEVPNQLINVKLLGNLSRTFGGAEGSESPSPENSPRVSWADVPAFLAANDQQMEKIVMDRIALRNMAQSASRVTGKRDISGGSSKTPPSVIPASSGRHEKSNSQDGELNGSANLKMQPPTEPSIPRALLSKFWRLNTRTSSEDSQR